MAFPENPELNETYVDGTTSFIWDGGKWITTAGGGANFATGATGPTGLTGATGPEGDITGDWSSIPELT